MLLCGVAAARIFFGAFSMAHSPLCQYLLSEAERVMAMNAVTIRGLGWKYSGRDVFAIEGVDLSIPANSFVSVVGPNEHGKTTLVSCIKGIIPHSFHGVWRGRWRSSGRTCAPSPPSAWRRRLGLSSRIRRPSSPP